MDALKTSAATRAGFWKNLGQIIAAAPAMVLSVYGVPVVLLVAGVVCALLALINALLDRLGITYDILATTNLLAKLSIAFSVASLPAYWFISAAYGLGVYWIGVKPVAPVLSRPGESPAPAGRLQRPAATPPSPPEAGARASKALVIEAP